MKSRFGQPHPDVPSNKEYRNTAAEQFELAVKYHAKGDVINAEFFYTDCISCCMQLTSTNSNDQLLLAKSYSALYEFDSVKNPKFAKQFKEEAENHSVRFQLSSPNEKQVLINKMLKKLDDENTTLLVKIHKAGPTELPSLQVSLAKNERVVAAKKLDFSRFQEQKILGILLNDLGDKTIQHLQSTFQIQQEKTIELEIELTNKETLENNLKNKLSAQAFVGFKQEEQRVSAQRVTQQNHQDEVDHPAVKSSF